MHYRFQLLKQFRYNVGGTVQSDLMRQLCKLVQVVCHANKIAHGGDFLGRVFRHNLRVGRGISDIFGKCPVCLSAAKTQTVVIGFGEFYRNGLGEFAEAACFRSPFGLDFIFVAHITWFTVISHFTVMMYLTICDRWERIASTTSGVERGFRASRKITSLPPTNRSPTHRQIQECLTAVMQSADTLFIGHTL